MGIELDDLMLDVLTSEAFGFIGVVADSKQPVITRLFGFKYDNPITTLTVYTFKKDAQRVVDILSKGSKLSITVSNVLNYKTCQFKGTYHSHYITPEEEMHYLRENNIKQGKHMNAFGVSSEVWESWKFEPSVAIVMNVEEIFDQTPRVNTGNKIN